MRNKKGFTLIELLVVIAIIGLLSTLSVVSLNGARKKARDAKRLSDIKTIQTAVEMYRTEKEKVPTSLTDSDLLGYVNGSMPIDPQDTSGAGSPVYDYCYKGTDSYLIRVKLENAPTNNAGLNANINTTGATCLKTSVNGTVISPGSATPCTNSNNWVCYGTGTTL